LDVDHLVNQLILSGLRVLLLLGQAFSLVEEVGLLMVQLLLLLLDGEQLALHQLFRVIEIRACLLAFRAAAYSILHLGSLLIVITQGLSVGVLVDTTLRLEHLMVLGIVGDFRVHIFDVFLTGEPSQLLDRLASVQTGHVLAVVPLEDGFFD